MGVGGAGDGTVGFVAVNRARLGVLFAALALLSGCKTVPEIAGLITGGVAGGATGSPAVGFAVGVGTYAAADYIYKSTTRRWHRTEQDAIAEAAGALAEGGDAPWRVRHDLPLGNEHGTLHVVRDIPTPLADCKQVMFSIEDDDTPPVWYAADICRQAHSWKWATAEPAVERWGSLQ